MITKRESVTTRACCSSSAFLTIITCLVTLSACRARLYYTISYYISNINHITSCSIALCETHLLSLLSSPFFLIDLYPG